MSDGGRDQHAERDVICLSVAGIDRARSRRRYGDAQSRHTLALTCFILLIPFGLPAILIAIRGGGAGAAILGVWLVLAVTSVVACSRALREIRRRERGRICENCGYPRGNPHDAPDPSRLSYACPECGAEYPWRRVIASNPATRAGVD